MYGEETSALSDSFEFERVADLFYSDNFGWKTKRAKSLSFQKATLNFQWVKFKLSLR